MATGVPRVDPMFDAERRAASLAAVASAFPQTVGRTVILFAPTFRGHGAKTAYFDTSRVDVAALHALCVERDAVCLVQPPPVRPRAARDPGGDARPDHRLARVAADARPTSRPTTSCSPSTS